MIPQALTAEFREKHGAFVDYVSTVVDKGFDLNKQISTFHERLIFISIGTLSLSITALMALIPKIAGASFPRQTFIKFVAPAWILLFVSITFSRIVMGHLLVANKLLLDQWKRLGDTYNLKQLVLSVTELSKTFSGTVEIHGKAQDVSAFLADVAKRIDKALPTDIEAQIDRETKAGELTKKAVTWLTHVAVLSLQAALVLLCIAAIKLFLSF